MQCGSVLDSVGFCGGVQRLATAVAGESALIAGGFCSDKFQASPPARHRSVTIQFKSQG